MVKPFFTNRKIPNSAILAARRNLPGSGVCEVFIDPYLTTSYLIPGLGSFRALVGIKPLSRVVPKVPTSSNSRDSLVRQHSGLVHYLARRLHKTLADDTELDELISAGMHGLLAAATSFEAHRGLAFSTHATPRIRGAMLDDLRRLDSLSRTTRMRARLIDARRNALSHQLGRAPVAHELADALGMSLRKLWEWEVALRSGVHCSIDAPTEDTPEADHPLGDRIPAPEFDLDLELDREVERERLKEALNALDPTAQRVMRLSFFEERTLREIARAVGLSESGVSRIRTRALEQLRNHLCVSRSAAA